MRILLLDNIRSMQNVGAIFRNADGAGFDMIYICGCTPTPPRNEISKTALGAEKTINWEYRKESLELIGILKNRGYTVYSVELDERSRDYTTLMGNTPKNICLVVGNEVSGISHKILDISDEIIMIPMLGKKESLNVSVAAGIVMYATI